MWVVQDRSEIIRMPKYFNSVQNTLITFLGCHTASVSLVSEDLFGYIPSSVTTNHATKEPRHANMCMIKETTHRTRNADLLHVLHTEVLQWYL